jgi:hypothetical protein
MELIRTFEKYPSGASMRRLWLSRFLLLHLFFPYLAIYLTPPTPSSSVLGCE